MKFGNQKVCVNDLKPLDDLTFRHNRSELKINQGNTVLCVVNYEK
jgi:hypothetical protein